jgi:diguanylate cyclase (GGDEF)-like protein
MADMADEPPIPNAGLLALLDVADIGACLINPHGWRVVYANRALLRAAGLKSLEGRESLVEWLPELAVPKNLEQLEAVAAGQLSGMTISIRLGGHDTSATIRKVETNRGAYLAVTVSLAVAATDDSNRGGIDSLTGLADRGRLMERLKRLVQGVRSSYPRYAVLFLDLDGFKQVNDAHGHLVGDEVLREVARRLVGCVRAGDMVARFGGDEFVVLLECVSSDAEIAPVLCRLQSAFEPPIVLPQGNMQIGVSVGVARACIDGATAEELVSAADRAMYAAKRKAGGL